ncbi:hypothetical protein ABH926_001974 [Catenulispora sp. GP43]|uniref:hypothetical protein n=1 Tax=Catenulispora sp. GP43 TaxID=3156263 RepID=UPI0035159498
MTTDERSDGGVHGLLATAFDDGVPVLNLVPGAVEGYRRHRRRARVLGTVGGALALAGVVVAGTASGAGSGHRSQNTAVEPGGSAVSPRTAARCTGTYQLIGGATADQYSTGQQGLTAVCEQDLTTLQQLTGDPDLGPLAESYPSSGPSSEPTAEMTPQIGGSGAVLQPGDYLGQSYRGGYHVSIEVYNKTPSLGENCTSTSCPPNLRLADGRPATKLTGPLRDSFVVIHYDAAHAVVVRAGLEDRNSEDPLPFDFDKLIASPALARLISYDVRTLDLLTHPS